MLKSICVYCGSSLGHSDIYAKAARSLAQELVRNNIELIYGGGGIGLMGVLANEIVSLGGKATGVIPKGLLEKEKGGHQGLAHLYIVQDMHERKALMSNLADGFIAMPGGIGTLEELFEAFTWSQLGFHKKPIGLLNVNGFYDPLIQLINHLVSQGFLKTEHAHLLQFESEAVALLKRFQVAASSD